MTITKKYLNEMLRTVLVLSALLSAASAVDCNGKSFRCVNSTHFMICVDLGGGVSQAIDNFFIACPPPTVCQGTNHFECEFPAPTTAATTISNVISETTLPWEEVVTASSLGNSNKEFSENYINTEKITTTAEYSVTTDATVDWTAINTSALNIYNETNTPEIEPTLAPEIASTAMETNQTVNENVYTTEYVPTVGAGDIITGVIEIVSQITTISQNLTETDPVVVYEITATDVETTTENIIITDTTVAEIENFAPSATEHVAQTMNESLNITETVPTGVGNVTQTTTESHSFTEREPVVVDNIKIVDTTTENIIITDTTAADIVYIEPSATEQVAQTYNESLNITEAVPTGVENVTQTTTDSHNFPEREPVVVDNITIVETTTKNIIITDTTAADTVSIAPSATEQVAPTINENLNKTETVPTGVDNVTQTTTVSKNLTETEPVVVDGISATTVESTTENIIITDTIAAEIDYISPSAIDQVAPTINKNLNKTETVTTGVDNDTRTTTESKNLTETEPVVVDGISATTVESTTENSIITDIIAAEMDYVSPIAIDQVAPTINKNLNITETVPTDVENVIQPTTETKNLTETETAVVDGISATTVESTTDNFIITDTIAAEIDYISPSAINQVAPTINKNLNKTENVPTGVKDVTQTTTESKNLSESDPLVVDNITATVVESKTENISLTDTIPAEKGFIAPSAIEQVAQTKDENLNITETAPRGVENVTQTTTETKNLTETEPVVVDNITIVETTTDNIIITDAIAAEIDYITPSATEQVPQPINQNRNKTETVPMDLNKDIKTTIIEKVTQTTAQSGILTQTELVETYEITATTTETTTDKLITLGNLGLELGYTEPTSTEQVTQHTNGNMLELVTVQSNTIEEIITTVTTQNIVTENIIHPSQAVNIGTINTDALLTTVTNAQSIPPAFEDNMKFEILMPVTENIESAVINGASIKVLATSQPVNVDTINTEAMYIPTTITSAPPLAPGFEDNMIIHVPLPTTENVISSVNNGATENGLTTAHAVNVDNINEEAINTIISSTQPIAPTFEEHISTNVSLAAIDNILFSVNNGTVRDGLTTPQAVIVDTINTETIPTTFINASPMVPAFEENVTTNVSLVATEILLSLENNGTDTKDLTTAQAVNVDNINTDTMYIPIKITNAPPMASAFEDNNGTTDDPLLRNENKVFSLNNGGSTNGFMTTQALNAGVIDTDTMYVTTTTNNFPPIAPDFAPAPNNIIFPQNPLDLVQITQKAGLETIVQLTTDKYFPPSKTVVNGDIITNEIVRSVPVVIKESPNTIIQKTQIILNSSTDTGVKLDAIDSDVKENYNDNKMTSIDINNMFEITNATIGSDVKSVSHISQTGPGNIENNLFPNAYYNQNKVTSAINELTHSNGKPTEEDVKEQAPVNNVAISQTGPSPISINGNIAKVTKTKSILDISNQNWISQQGESKNKQATNNLQPGIVEHNDQADNITWNPLASQVFNNQKPESIRTSSVTNINDNTNDKNVGSLNSQSEIPENLKPVDFETAGADVPSVPTILPATTSGADFTIRDSIKNTNKPMENSVNLPPGSAPVEVDNNRKSQQNIQVIRSQDSSVASISTTSDIKPEMKSSKVKDGKSDSPTVVNNNLPSQSITSQFELPTNTHSFSQAHSIGTPMEGNKVIKENVTTSKTVMLDLLPLPINNIKFIAHTATKPVLIDLNSNSQVDNTAIITESYKSETLKPIVAETGTQDSGHGGDITPVTRIRDPGFNFQIGITDRTSGNTTVPTVGGSTSNSQTSGVSKTGSSATYNSQTQVTDGADVLSQHSAQQIEKIPNTMARAPNNAHAVPGSKPSGSGIITNNPDLHSPNSSNNVNTGIITSESVSESNYESHMSENIMPQVVVIGYQKNNSTVVVGLNFGLQNDTFDTQKEPPNSIGSDHTQAPKSNPSTNNSSSIFTPAQKISTSTARTPSQTATSNPISHLNNNLTQQVPTVAAQTFSCIYGIRGRYSDKGDCRKFYICIGINEPIVGYCPENTVFSDLKKQCTKNMSHCIRENQFKCPSDGRFSDFMKHNVYYICVSHKNHLYRFKFECQKGYILDKTTIKCIEIKEIESNESVSISSDNSSQTSSSAISSSTSSKSSSSNTSKSSSRADDRSKNSSKTNKSNEAEETSGKSEGKDDDEDDEVFKCKERGKFPIRNECRRYYLCKKGRRSEYRRKIKKCDSDQVFHKNKKKCVDEDSYEC